MSAWIRTRRFLAGLIGGAGSELPRLVRQLESERTSLLDAQAVAAVGSWETDLRTLDVVWSAETRRIFGIGAAFQPTHQRFLDLIHPDDRSAVDAAFKGSVGQTGPHAIEHRILLAEGRVKYIQERWRTFSDAAGQPLRAVGTSQDITERKDREAALRDSDERFRMLADHISDAFWIRSADMRTLYYISPAFERIWGRPVAELYARPHAWSEFIVPEDRERVLEAFHALAQGSPLDLEYRIARPDGEVRWVRVRGFEVRGAGGDVIRHAGIVTDVTDSRRAAEALQASVAKFRTLAEAVPQIVWMTRADGWNEYFNQRWVDYTGLSLEESAGHGWSKPFHPADRQRAERAWTHAVATRGVYSLECLLRRADGAYRWWLIRGAPLVESDGSVRKWFGTCTDIHELKLAQLEVSRTNRALAMLSMSAGPAAGTGSSFFEQLARNLVDALGAQGAFVSEMLPVEPSTVRIIAGVVEGSPAASFDCAVGGTFCDELLTSRMPSGAELSPERCPPQLALAAPRARAFVGRRLSDAAGTPIGLLFVVYRELPADTAFATATLEIFTARAASELERQRSDARARQQNVLLLRAQRLESIGTLASGIAHDLNNMLTPILMAVSVLDEIVTDETGRGVLATVHSSAQRGADLVKQVLSFSRGVEGQRIPVDSVRLMRDLIGVMRGTLPKSIDIDFVCGDPLWTVTGDPTQIHQVFMNLFVNARDAMAGSGHLVVSMDNVVVDDALTRVNIDVRPGIYVRVRIADDGEGIPAEQRDRIFEPFFTTKPIGEGTGLGLSTSLAIVKSHGGFIQLESHVGLGTTFDVYLPANTTPATVDPPVTQPARVERGNGKLVLVVDDEDGILKLVQRLLERQGYRTLIASDGKVALDLYSRHQNEIALVLTDMAMPIMDGRELILALKAINPAVRIVASSGLTSIAGMAQAIRDGAEQFVPKPYTGDALLRVLQAVLNPAPQTGVAPSLESASETS